MSNPVTPSRYGQLVQQTPIPESSRAQNAEEELDLLIGSYKNRQRTSSSEAGALQPDRIEALRELTLNDLIPIFVVLAEKYAESGIAMQMDASNFLRGGRELKFEFSLGAYRADLMGTVTSDAIAFHETRSSPDVHGELVSGPMLRLRTLSGDTFRDFVCERLSTLVRAAMRRH